MAEENQFEEQTAAQGEPEGAGEQAGEQPWNLIPVSAEEHAKGPRQTRILIAVAVVVVAAVAGWTYKRSVDPIEALEAFDAGERLLKTARYQQAIVSFDRAISLNGDFAEAYLMRGRANASLAKPLEAIPDFSSAIELGPEDPLPLLDRGMAHVSLQEWPEALADFTKAIDLDPKLSKAYNLRGTAVRSMGDASKALPDFTYAAELEPNMDNLFQRGATYQLLNQHEKAIADFSRVISAEPGSAQAYFARAQSFRAMGDIASANRDHRTGRILDGK